jgi:hypothetical protein
MTGYPKIWTSLLFKDWFVQLKLNEKGIYFWLILEAKNQGDTGTIICRNLVEFSTRIGVDRKTLGRILEKLTQIGKITYSKDGGSPVVICVNNYRKYQELKAANSVCQKVSEKFSTSDINQTRLDNNQAGAGALDKIKSIPPGHIVPARPGGTSRICKQCGQQATAFIEGVCLKCKGL